MATSTSNTLRDLSDRLVDIQRPIRVLNAVRWDDEVKAEFFAQGFREQPSVDASYYEREKLSYNPAELRMALRDLGSEAHSRLGGDSPAAQLLGRSCRGYRLALSMIEARGTEAFGRYSAELYGTPHEVFHPGGPTVSDLADSIAMTLDRVEGPEVSTTDADVILSGAEAVVELQRRLDDSMGQGVAEVRLDDGIVADAAAGSDYIKLRADASFTVQNLATLEAHEGWVHIGTTRNGLAQPHATFLGKAAPPVTVTQEGLATVTEILSLRSHPSRLRRLINRVRGIELVLDGANFVELFEYLRVEGLDEEEAWQTAARIFRGSTPTGPPFSKDLAYGKGLALTYIYLRLALREQRPDRIPMLFCGKVDLQAMDLVLALFDEGLVEAPAFVPPPFRDTDALAAQIAFSRFLREVDFDQMIADRASRT